MVAFVAESNLAFVCVFGWNKNPQVLGLCLNRQQAQQKPVPDACPTTGRKTCILK
jgi:hypothetical protein